jgi:hypothetical protein
MLCLLGKHPVAYFNSINKNNVRKPHITTLNRKLNRHNVPSNIQSIPELHSCNLITISNKIYNCMWHTITQRIHTDLTANH